MKKFRVFLLILLGLSFVAVSGPASAVDSVPLMTNSPFKDGINPACGDACTNGASCCSGSCVDVRSNNTHCGSCSITCAGGQTCTNGSCSEAPVEEEPVEEEPVEEGPKANGESCTENSGCLSGHCSELTPACVSGLVHSSCSGNDDCETGMACKFVSNGPGNCLKNNGVACSEGSDCYSTFCVSGSCNSSGGGTLPDGSECNTGADCVSGNCAYDHNEGPNEIYLCAAAAEGEREPEAPAEPEEPVAPEEPEEPSGPVAPSR